MSDELEHDDQLVLSELLNHVLDKGVVIIGDVTISVADIDLIRVGLSLHLSSVESLRGRTLEGESAAEDDALRLLPGDRGA